MIGFPYHLFSRSSDFSFVFNWIFVQSWSIQCLHTCAL